MKKAIYIFSWFVLGLLLSLVFHSLLEMGLIYYAVSKGIVLFNYTSFGGAYCVLPKVVQILNQVFWPVFGLFCGRYFWRTIYVEHRYHSRLEKYFKK